MVKMWSPIILLNMYYILELIIHFEPEFSICLEEQDRIVSKKNDNERKN